MNMCPLFEQTWVQIKVNISDKFSPFLHQLPLTCCVDTFWKPMWYKTFKIEK